MENKYYIGQILHIDMDKGRILRVRVVNVYDGILALNPIGTWEIYDIKEKDFKEHCLSEYGHRTYSYFVN